MASIDMKKYWK